MKLNPCCTGPVYSAALGRRSFVQVGMLGGLGVSLSDVLRAQSRVRAEGDKTVRPEGRAKSVIQIIFPGGMSHQESWDPKPEAPIEYRGPLGVVKTSIPGIVFSENLERTAKIANKISVIRSITGRVPDHSQATYHMFTGYVPSPAISHPSIGSVVAHEFGSRNNLPGYIGVPRIPVQGGTGYLSSKYGAFELGADPAQKSFQVRDVALPKGVSEEQFARRRTARQAIEDHFREAENNPTVLDTMDEFYQQAYKLISSPDARKAFTLDGEPESMHKLYGTDMNNPKTKQPSGIGRRLMLARRLVEAGARFVTVQHESGWDNHVRIKDAFNNNMPPFDYAFAGLITDLEQRGLLDTTLVMVTTEFGRTPKVNDTAGRDHWARCFSLVLAGGGITKGQIYGSSNATAAEPDQNPVTIEDYLFTVYHQLGINASDRLVAPGGRPIDIIRGGQLVRRLIA